MAFKEVESEELKKLKRSTSALRGVFTKHVNGLTKLILSAYPGSPAFLATLIQENQVKLTTSFDNLSASLAQLMDTDDSEDAFSTWNSKLQSCEEEHAEATQRAIQALAIIHSPIQNPPQLPPPPAAQNAQNHLAVLRTA